MGSDPLSFTLGGLGLGLGTAIAPPFLVFGLDDFNNLSLNKSDIKIDLSATQQGNNY